MIFKSDNAYCDKIILADILSGDLLEKDIEENNWFAHKLCLRSKQDYQKSNVKSSNWVKKKLFIMLFCKKLKKIAILFNT